jgi:hypothetical protein
MRSKPLAFFDMLSKVPCRDGGAPGGGGGGGREVEEGENVGLARGIGGTRFSGESCDNSSDARYELRLEGACAEGVRGDCRACASVISSPDSDPGVGERIGGTGRAMKSAKVHYR